jgi:hypothetical protein
MPERETFAFVQARLAARHSRRPNHALWQRLQASTDLANFLDIARRSVLAPWVAHLSPGSGAHAIEASLRQEVYLWIQQIAGWQPARWRPAVRWTGHLPELPLVGRLMTDRYPPSWVRHDPRLRRFASLQHRERLDALRRSVWAPLVGAYQNGQDLATAWAERWRSLWPAKGDAQGLDALAASVAQHRWAMGLAETAGGSARGALGERAERLFRRYPRRPVAVFCHLLLVGLDLERLRGELVRRAVFSDGPATG